MMEDIVFCAIRRRKYKPQMKKERERIWKKRKKRVRKKGTKITDR